MGFVEFQGLLARRMPLGELRLRSSGSSRECVGTRLQGLEVYSLGCMRMPV